MSRLLLELMMRRMMIPCCSMFQCKVLKADRCLPENAVLLMRGGSPQIHWLEVCRPSAMHFLFCLPAQSCCSLLHRTALSIPIKVMGSVIKAIITRLCMLGTSANNACHAPTSPWMEPPCPAQTCPFLICKSRHLILLQQNSGVHAACRCGGEQWAGQHSRCGLGAPGLRGSPLCRAAQEVLMAAVPIGRVLWHGPVLHAECEWSGSTKLTRAESVGMRLFYMHASSRSTWGCMSSLHLCVNGNC